MHDDHPTLVRGTLVRWHWHNDRGIGYVAFDTTSPSCGRVIRINNIDSESITNSVLDLDPEDIELLPNTDVYYREGLYTLVDNNGVVENVYVHGEDDSAAFIEHTDGSDIPEDELVHLLTDYTWHYVA